MNPIRECRLRRDMSQEDLARQIGVDRSNIAKWETGVHKPRADMLLLLSKVLQCSVDDLLRGWEKESALQGKLDLTRGE